MACVQMRKREEQTFRTIVSIYGVPEVQSSILVKHILEVLVPQQGDEKSHVENG